MPIAGITTPWRGTAGWQAEKTSQRPPSFRKEAEMELQDSNAGRRGGKFRPVEDPTLEQIAERCLEVQAKWSEREKLNRSGMTRFLWRPQRITFDLERMSVQESFT
jgi:hypothetical protein